VIGAAVALLPMIRHFEAQITQKISVSLERPVIIGQINGYWSGIHPWVELDDFTILDNNQTSKLVQIQKIKLGINILSSLVHRQIMVNDVIIDGSQLVIRELPDNKISVNDIVLPNQSSDNSSNNLAYLKNINYYLSNVDLTWERADKTSVSLHNVHASYAYPTTQISSENLIIHLPALSEPLVFEKLNGKLFLDYPNFKTSDVTLQWFGKPMLINIDSKRSNDQNRSINVDISGTLPVTELAKNQNLTLVNKIARGSADFKANWQLLKQDQKIQNIFTFDSDLQGIEFILPGSFKKLSTEIYPSHLVITTSDNQMTIIANYEKKLSVALLLEQNSQHSWTIPSGDILFGGSNASLQNQKNIVVRGTIPHLDLAELVQYFYLNESNHNASTNLIKINNIDINFDNLFIAGFPLHATRIEANTLNHGWSVRLMSRDISGKLIIPENFASTPLKIDFDHFYLSSATLTSMEKSSSDNGIQPSQIPSLNITFKNFYYDKNNLGKIQIVTTRKGDSFIIDKFTVNDWNVSLSMTGHWDGRGTQSTTLCGHVKTCDFGEFLREWELSESLKGSKGKVDFTLRWQGPLYKINLGKLNGNLLFKLENGVILDVVSKKVEMLGRFLNAISIDSLQQLFSKPFGSIAPNRGGFDFDVEEGGVNIINGNVYTENFYLHGKLAQVKAQGRIGLVKRDYDLYVVITPFLTAYLPAYLALGPGIIMQKVILVSDKLTGGLLNGLFRINYHVTGTWSDPHYEKVSNVPERHSQMQYSW